MSEVVAQPRSNILDSIFLEHFIAGLGISRSLVSTFYTIGTLTGSFTSPLYALATNRRPSRL